MLVLVPCVTDFADFFLHTICSGECKTHEVPITRAQGDARSMGLSPAGDVDVEEEDGAVEHLNKFQDGNERRLLLMINSTSREREWDSQIKHTKDL